MNALLSARVLKLLRSKWLEEVKDEQTQRYPIGDILLVTLLFEPPVPVSASFGKS